MSFAVGMGAGMGAGIGCGIPIGISSGQKQACEQIREYVEANSLTIRDQAGEEVDVDDLLAKAVTDRSSEQEQGSKFVLAILLLLGVVVLGVLAYLFFR